MTDRKIKRALISVYDKTGIVEFVKSMAREFGVEIISTGGTAKLLAESGVAVTPVEAVTGFPEMMDGRVKTLHPKIHAAILADRDNPEHMRQLAEQSIEPIDMVVVNLYPFEKTVANPDCTFEQAIEMIDIGGPSMLRAAAKNHRHLAVLSRSAHLEVVLEQMRGAGGAVSAELLVTLAHDVFAATSAYDAAIEAYLATKTGLTDQQRLHLPSGTLYGRLRYGENPHQTAAAYRTESSSLSVVRHPTVGGTELSFNNLVDADAALGLCYDLTHGLGQSGGLRTCVFIKHTNACGVGVSTDRTEAYRQAYLGDPNAAMGGILACDFDVDAAFAEGVMETYDRWGKEAGVGGFFVEVWIAPTFDTDAVKMIRTRKKWGDRIRLVTTGPASMTGAAKEQDIKRIAGGVLVQDGDDCGLNEGQWKVVTKRTPTDQELSDLRLAWLVCKHTKSNAITVCKDHTLIGNGAGQMSRVMSCRIATWLAKENGHAESLAGSAAASDAFFPFRDGPDILMDAGIKAIIQPGGSKRDEDTVAACDERDVAMILTGTRHFKH